MQQRSTIYNRSLSMIRLPSQNVNIVEVYPPENFSIARLSRSTKALDAGYQLDQEQAEHAIRQWNEHQPAV